MRHRPPQALGCRAARCALSPFYTIAMAMMILTPLTTSRIWLRAFVTAFFLICLWISTHGRMAMPSLPRVAPFQNSRQRCGTAAGNSTLGFNSIQYLNLPFRTDRDDAMILQAYLTGLDLTLFPGVNVDTIRENGLPPMTEDSYVNISEIACWRAHANVRFRPHPLPASASVFVAVLMALPRLLPVPDRH